MTKAKAVKADEAVEAVEAKTTGGRFVTTKQGTVLADADRPGTIYTNRTPVEVAEVTEGSWLDCQVKAGLICKY